LGNALKLFMKRREARAGIYWFTTTAAVVFLAACQSWPDTSHRLTEAQIATLKQEGFRQTDEGWAFSASDKLLFATDDAKLKPDACQKVQRIGRVLLATQVGHIFVNGYTDATGSKTYNEQLSRHRAEAVSDELINAGISPGNIQTRGYGESDPVASNSTVGGREQNRRVAIVLSIE
jgi:outer membrane protein OmpA-like peptidoglycan-associated protein